VRFRGLTTTLKQPSIIDLKKQNEIFQKDSEKLKKILQQYEGRRKKLIEQIAYEKAELVNGGM
jgi:kinetochore protein NDC80